jgi:soluble lytic murein transglycosylase-like protein
MRDLSDRVQPRLQSERHLLAAQVARELRLLSLSDGLSFCVLLRDRRDPRFEKELKRWLERARECGVSSEDAELLGAAVAALEGEFRELALEVIKRAHRQLPAVGSRSLSRSGRPRSRLRRRSTLAWSVAEARPALRKVKQWRVCGNRPVWHRPTASANARRALVAAAASLALGISVMEARGDAELMAARGGAETRIAGRLAESPPRGRCPIPARLRGAFVVAAKKTDLPLSLLVAVALAESHFDSTARSTAGAIGVLQLMPATARALGVDPTDPHANVVAGARYLRSLFNRFDSAQLALAAYNAGPTSVSASAGALPTETKAYVAKVRRTSRLLRGCR